MASIQADFSAGIYVGRKAPAGAVYDTQNGLVDDEGNLFRRGATAYQSGADAAATLEGLQDVYLSGGRRTVFWSETAEDVYTLASDDSTVVTVSASGTAFRKFRRGVVFHGLLWMPASKILGSTSLGIVAGYGGSRKTSDPSTSTIDVTSGSTTVNGTGTSWLTTVDPGMVLERTTGLDLGVGGIVRTVTSDTALELVDPWSRTTAAGVGGNFWRLHEGPPLYTDDSTDPAYVATAGHRLLIAQGRRVYFTPPDSPWSGDRHTDYHELPEGALIVGADALHDIALIFTTAGVWAIENLVFDVIDDAGNVQHQVEQVTKDVILWGDSGIAAWSGALVVPAVDDVYLFDETGQATPINEAIRPKYREYVNAGYQPGIAAVDAGHYVLPILNGSTVIDTLVCRLDRPFQTPSGQTFRPWTTWEGHASGAACAQRVGADTREPKLFGISGQRVTDLTGTLGGQGAEDADGNDIAFSFTTNDLPLGFGTATRLRSWYEMTLDAVTISAAATPSSDTFTRANETPLASPWLAWRSGKPNLASNAAEIDSDLSVTECSATRPETIAAGCYAQATFKTAATYSGDPAMTYYVGVRLTAHSSAAGGYVMLLEPGSGGWQARIAKGSARTTVATSTVRNYSAVQAIRLVASGSYLYALVKIGGTWTVAVSVSDSDFRDEGLVGFGITKFFGTPVAVDEFDWAEIDAPSILPEFSSDQDGGSFTALTALGEQGGQTGWGVSDGSRYSWANVNKKRDRIRFRFTLAGAATSLKVRAVELLSRASGKQ